MRRPIVKAIPTKWNGVQFRSRLEARWAAVFDYMGYDWYYEPEGYELPSGRYLPDFLVREPDGKTYYDHWIEIKPTFPTESELKKAAELTSELENGVLIFYGSFGAKQESPEHWWNEMGNPQSGPVLFCPGSGTYSFSIDETRLVRLSDRNTIFEEFDSGDEGGSYCVYGHDSKLVANPLQQRYDSKLLEAIEFAKKLRFW